MSMYMIILVSGPVDVCVPESDIQSTSLKVSWKEARGDITSYRVHCKNSAGDIASQYDVGNFERSYVIQELMPETEYIISVSGLHGDTESLPVPFGGLSIKTECEGVSVNENPDATIPEPNLSHSITGRELPVEKNTNNNNNRRLLIHQITGLK